MTEPTPDRTPVEGQSTILLWAAFSAEFQFTFCKWPKIELVKCAIVHVRRVAGLDQIPHAVLFLLIRNQMFDRGDDTGALNALYGKRSAKSLENRVRAKALPVSAASWFPAEWSYAGAEMNVYAFATELLSYRHTTTLHEVLVPCRSDSDSRWKCGVVISVPHT